MIEWAQHYARSGWPVFPLAAGAKVPAVPRKRGGHGCLDATLDLARIEEWWTAYPQANVGVATGLRSGLLVIDVDPRKTAEWLTSVQALALPQTFTVRTCSGGWHLYFGYSFAQRVTIGADLLPGIDWRGEGGYVVAPGSTVDGKLYEIARNVPIARIPEALIERILATRAVQRIERDQGGHMVIPASRRNDSLMRMGCALRRWGVEGPAILAALEAVNAEHCDPRLESGEIAQIAASAARYAPVGPSRGTAA